MSLLEIIGNAALKSLAVFFKLLGLSALLLLKITKGLLEHIIDVFDRK